MSRTVAIAGSGAQELDDARVTAGGLRLPAEELATLREVAIWWRHRRAVGDSADPLETHFGGVDARHAVQTVGLVPAEVAAPKPLLLERGASYWLHALGVPQDMAAAGEVYSLLGLCHFARDPALGLLSRYATIGRAPAGVTSTEARSAVSGSPPDQTPVILLVGVAGQTIDWTVELYRLEVG